VQVGDFDSRQRLQLGDGTDADHLLEVVWSPNLETSFLFQICWMVTLLTKLVKSYFKCIKCNIQRTHTHTRNWRSRIRCSFLRITNTSKDNPYISHYARCPVREQTKLDFQF
jgi:hypothetical protein